MMMSPIGSFLAEFRPFSHLAMPFIPPGEQPEPEPHEAAREAIPAIDTEATDRAVRTAREQAAAASSAAIEALKAEHADHLEAERRRWAEAEGGVLARQIAEGLAALEHRLAAGLGDVLQPLLPQAAAAKAARELNAAIATLLHDDAERAIRISGPADLLADIARAYGDTAGVAFAADEAPEVTILAGETRIESRMRLWAGTLDTALGADR